MRSTSYAGGIGFSGESLFSTFAIWLTISKAWPFSGIESTFGGVLYRPTQVCGSRPTKRLHPFTRWVMEVLLFVTPT